MRIIVVCVHNVHFPRRHNKNAPCPDGTNPGKTRLQFFILSLLHMSSEEIALIAIDLLCLLQVHVHMADMGHVLLLLCSIAFPLGINPL